MSTTSKVSAELGQKLLQGWTMLAESCNDCNVPLMEKKKDQIIVCVGCKKNFRRDVEQGDKLQTSIVPITNNVETKPNIPNNVETKSNIPSVSTPTVDNKKVSAPVDTNRHILELNDEKKFKTRQISQLMGDKLLEGWSLLGDTCPICNSPLMKYANAMKCFTCDKKVVFEKDNKEEEEDLFKQTKQEMESKKRGREDVGKQTEIPAKIEVPAVSQIPPFMESNVVERTKQTLYFKMDECQHQLANITPANRSSIQGIITAITECAKAISALENIKYPQ